MKEPVKDLAKLLLRNEQGSPLPQMHAHYSLMPHDKILGAIIVHTATVLRSNSQQSYLLPFVNMLDNPAALVVRPELHQYLDCSIYLL